MAGWMDKVKTARVSKGGIYVLPGAYLVEITGCKAGTTREGKENFIVELLIHESNHPERRVGTLMDWYVDMSKEPSPGNVKEFVMEATNCTGEEVSGDAIRLICGEIQPLKGIKLRLSASNIKVGAKKDKDFTKVTWLPVQAPQAA